jgi:hypothetical protein
MNKIIYEAPKLEQHQHYMLIVGCSPTDPGCIPLSIPLPSDLLNGMSDFTEQSN